MGKVDRRRPLTPEMTSNTAKNNNVVDMESPVTMKTTTTTMTMGVMTMTTMTTTKKKSSYGMGLFLTQGRDKSMI